MRREKVSLLLLKVLFVASSFILNIKLVKEFGEESSGLYFHFISVVNILSVICVFGFNTQFLKVFSRAYKSKTVISRYVIKSSFIVLINILILSFILYLVNYDGNISQEQLVLMVALFSLISLVSSSLQGMNHQIVSFFIFGGGVQTVILGGLLFIGFDNIRHLITMQELVIFAFSTIGICFILWSNKHLNKIENKTYRLKLLYSSGFPIFITQSINQFIIQSGIIFVGYLLSYKEVAVFAILYKFSLLFSHAFMVLNRLVYPKLANIKVSVNPQEVQKILDSSNLTIYVLTTIKCVIFYIAYPYIIGYLGEEFAGFGEVMVILILAQVFKVLLGPSNIMLQMIDKEIVARNISIMSFIICIVSNLVLLPLIGVLGAAISTLLSLSINSILASNYIYKRFNIRTYRTFGCRS